MPFVPQNIKAMTIARQGLCIVIALLTFELLFVGILVALVSQAEAEADRQAMARDINTKASKLLFAVYDTGDAVGKLTRTLDTEATRNFSASTEEATALIQSLRKDLKDDDNAMRLLSRIETNVAICLPVLTQIKNESAGLSKEDAQHLWSEKRRPIVRNADILLSDLQSLMDIGRRIEQEAPDIERRHREATRNALILGFIVNVIFGLLIAAFFTRRIVMRLDVLLDNTELLKKGLPLNERLEGDDEIARVDEVFHETADTLKKEEQFLKANEARVRAIIESAPIGVVVANAAGNIEFANSTIEKIFSYEAQDLQGKGISKLLPSAGEQPALSKSILDDLSQKATGHIIELQAAKKDGSLVPIDLTIANLDLGGEIQKMAMISDVSERYELKQLRQAFARMISDELKAPLTRIAGFLQNFACGALGDIPDKAVEQAKKSQQNIDRLITLLNDLLALENLEAGKIDVQPAPCSLKEILDKSQNAVLMFAQKHNVELQVDHVGQQVFADSNRIVQVLVNLLSNAIKFSNAGSIVTVRVNSGSGKLVRVEVIDCGRGIPQDKLDSVFEKFKQIEDGDSRKKGGTGLGLAICRAIIEAHAGEIGVSSEEGKGSTFWFTLPVEASRQA